MSDTHQHHHQIEVGYADLVIHAGDFSFDQWGIVEAKGAYNFFHWYAGLPHKHKVLIAGNHDFIMEKPTSTRHAMPEGITYLEGESVEIDGWKVWGGPWTPRFFDWAFNVDRGEAIKRYWDKIPDDTDILVTHGPPLGVLDNNLHGIPCGCEELRKAVERIEPKLHVFGHIHPGSGMETIGWKSGNKTTFVNASVVNERYDYVRPPIVVEIEKD
jgi:Icc-related predicted phosphoesterase